MDFWTEVHWAEGMFIRPHHFQAAQRRADTIARVGFDSLRPYAWGFVRLNAAPEAAGKTRRPLHESTTVGSRSGKWLR